MCVSKLRMKPGLAATVCTVCMALALSSAAQVQTQTQTTTATPTHEVVIESGTVVAVQGNNLFVKMADGSVRDFPNIPETARATVDGQQLSVHQLKPGMKLVRATVTTTTPMVVTIVQTVTGKVLQVTPPFSVTLSLENGESQAFKIPDGQKFIVDGQETDAFGLKEGMKITATKIVETPETTVTKGKYVIGTIPADAPILIAPK